MISLVNVPLLETPSMVAEDHSASAQMLDAIFCIDERTGLPMGSLAQFMSDKTSAQVKEFIDRNILHGGEEYANMADYQNSGLPSNVKEKFSELKSDFIADMARGRDETLEQYEARISDFLQTEKAKSYYYSKYGSKKSDDKK